MKSKANALYVHIPFCKNICFYCDFAKFIYNQERVDKYFESLFFDLKQIEPYKFKTIYIGGGTPSAIDKTNLEKLLSYLSKHLKDNYEFTIECNVEDINDDLLKLFVKYGINRLSIGVQTFNDKLIKIINRHHNKEMAINNINKASKYIENISVDMIYALPEQSFEDLKEDVSIITSLPIKHISYYSLLIEENTPFYARKIKELDDDIQADYYKYIYNNLLSCGFKRYEISNFAKNGFESKHNKVYWHNQHYYGIGLNASGYIGNIRYKNQNNIIKYINKDFNYIEKIKLDKHDKMFEQIMLNLRLDEGLNINSFNRRFKCDFNELFAAPLAYLMDQKLIYIDNNYLKTTFEGSLLLDLILEEFI